MRAFVFLFWLGQAGAATAPVTFTRDIAPILYQRCIACHRPGEVAPFPLLTYADAAKRAALIAQVTATRYMPPWKPEPGYGDFEGARGLTRAEIEAIRRWAATGAPEGNPADLPPVPAASSPKLAHADLAVRPRRVYGPNLPARPDVRKP